jgi:glycosyltransferase involved in cell wall biosynthesis
MKSKHETNLPILSVITVCLNEPELERTCKSIVNQTFQDFEWLVIDGESNAETQAVLEIYKSRMNYFVSEKDTGIYEAMNKGIKHSRGVWLNFMNAGDSFCFTNTLESINHTLKSNHDVAVIYGEYMWGYEEDCFKSSTPDSLSMEGLLNEGICHQSAFVHRSCFEKYGYYDERLDIVADHKLILTLFKDNAKFLKLNAYISTRNGGGICVTDRMKFNKECDTVLKGLYTEDDLIVFKAFQKHTSNEPTSTTVSSIANKLRGRIRSHNSDAIYNNLCKYFY